MYSNPEATPPALLHNLKHNKVLHERVVFLAVVTAEVPHVPAHDRVTVEELGRGFYRMRLNYGFMEEPNVPEALDALKEKGMEFRPLETTYFLGRETLIPSRRPGMAIWREVQRRTGLKLAPEIAERLLVLAWDCLTDKARRAFVRHVTGGRV